MTDYADLPRKLQIKPGARLWLVNVPPAIVRALTAGVVAKSVALGEDCDGAVVFADNASDVAARTLGLLTSVAHDGLVWFAYRKGVAAKASGVSRDTGWGPLRAAGWDTVRSVSIDEEWTGLRFRPLDLIKR